MWGVEFVSPGELGAFDAAVEVGTFWRQDHELEAVFLAMILEDGHELGSAVDLDAFDLERSGGDELVEQGFAALAVASAATWPRVHLATGS